MKTSGEVSQKLKQLRFRHIKRVLKKALRRAPSTCVHNKAVEITSSNERIGLCCCPELTLSVCDDVLGDRSNECSSWIALCEKEQLKQELKDTFESAPVSEISRLYPDVATLMWVLSESEDPRDSLMPGATLVGSLGGILIWADTPEEANEAQATLDLLTSNIQQKESPSWFRRVFRW
jgi:hypothetical protein